MAKVSRTELHKLAKDLGIRLPEQEFSRLLDRARSADDPQLVLREAAGMISGQAAAESAAPGAEAAEVAAEDPPPTEGPAEPEPSWPAAIIFFPNGTACVADQYDQQLGKYHVGRHGDTIAALAADGYDWRKLAVAGQPHGPPQAMRLIAPMATELVRETAQHVQIFFREEPKLQLRLEQLFDGLLHQNAKLQPRTPGERPRPVASRADALKWLLENLQPAT